MVKPFIFMSPSYGSTRKSSSQDFLFFTYLIMYRIRYNFKSFFKKAKKSSLYLEKLKIRSTKAKIKINILMLIKVLIIF